MRGVEGRFALGARLEQPVLRLSGNRGDEQSWLAYTLGLVTFNVVGVLAVYALQCLHGGLPFNPQGLGAVSPDSADDVHYVRVHMGNLRNNIEPDPSRPRWRHITTMMGTAITPFSTADQSSSFTGLAGVKHNSAPPRVATATTP